jgi:protein TonB
MLPGAKSPTRSAAVSAPVPEAPSVISPAETSAAPLPVSNPVAQISQPATAATVNSPAVAVHVDNVPASKVSQVSAPAPAQVQPSAPVNQRLPSRVADISGALSAHPVSAQRSASGDAEPAPSVDAGAAAPGSELEGISTSSAVPPPPAPAEAPIHVGGDVKPPKLTSTVLPTYPSIARSSGIEGSVVVDTAIDAAGNVTTTKVISGPAMLRQAAVDALRRWKYSPATLNGEPIAVHITVTINFHR